MIGSIIPTENVETPEREKLELKTIKPLKKNEKGKEEKREENEELDKSVDHVKIPVEEMLKKLRGNVEFEPEKLYILKF